MSTDDNGATSNINTAEAEVVVRQTSILTEEVPEVASNCLIESNTVTTDAAQIASEASKAAMPLLEDNDLSLDIANVLGDDSFREFLKNDKSLLDDVDMVGAAYKLPLPDENLIETASVKVVSSIEAIEVVQGGEASPVVEADGGTPITTSGNLSSFRLEADWAGYGTEGQKGCGNERLAEHVQRSCCCNERSTQKL